MFVKDSKMVIWFEKGHQYDTEEENENKLHGFSRKMPTS
jgi:hypothetical protein